MWQFISCLCIYLYAYNMDTSSPYSYKYIVLDNYIAARCNSSQWISEQLIHILPPILPHCQRPLISSQQISLSLKIPYGRVPTSKSIRVSHCPHRRLCAGSCQIIHAGKPKSRTQIETSILNKALVLICEPFSEVRSSLFSPGHHLARGCHCKTLHTPFVQYPRNQRFGDAARLSAVALKLL